MKEKDPHIDTLLQMVSEAAGSPAKTPGDLFAIVAFVEGRTHEAIGLTTVKRIWGYGGLSTQPRLATLNLLARSIGYRGYDDFRAHHADSTPSSDPVLGAGIRVDTLQPGNRIMLRWDPGREMTAEYLGNSTFRVVESKESKLQAGDTFQASWFAVGHAAMLANVVQQLHSWPLYEIGQQSGLTLVRQLPTA